MPNEEFKKPWPLPKRIDYIGKHTSKLSHETYGDIDFLGQTKWDVYLVDLDLPVYRLSNGRTLAHQREYIAKYKKPKNFFIADMESVEALRAQHSILKGMLNQEGLLDYFKNHNQRQPFILTQEGYIVNGNRRICAMRMLLAKDQKKYARFNKVRVIFLPPTDSTHIDELEAELQVHPELRAKYEWTTEAMMYRNRQKEHDWSIDDIARIHNKTNKQIEEYIAALELADQYLMERGKPDRYSLVEDQFYAFKKLREGRRKIKKPVERDTFTHLSYLLIDNPESAGGRLYDLIPDLQDNLEVVTSKIKAEVNQIPISGPSAEVSLDEDLDLLANDQGRDSGELSAFLQDEKAREIVRTVVQDAIQSIQAKSKQKKSADRALKEVSNAHTNLVSALNHLTKTSNVSGIDNHLNNITDVVRKIREWLKKNAKH